MAVFQGLLCFCLCLSLPLTLLGSSCEENIELTESSGTIKYPLVGDYPTSETCGWKIVPIDSKATSKVVIEFIKFDLVERPENSDYVEVFDGVDELYGKSLGIYTGNELPLPVVGSGRTMFIKFESTGIDNETAQGFEIKYSVSSCKDDCNGNGYCFDGNCQCENGFKGKTCSETYCRETSEGEHCGGESRGKCDTISKTEKQCKCNPGFYGGDCYAPRCSGVTKLTDKSGNFTDHHREGEAKYNENTLCQWIIYAPPPPPPSSKHMVSFIQLHFTQFSTEYEKDWVHVYDSETAEVSSLLGSFSGGVVPVDLLSSTGVMLVTYETNIGVEYEGFEASYEVYERKVDNGPTSPPQESKTVAAAFATITFFIGIVLGGAFSMMGGFEFIRIYC